MLPLADALLCPLRGPVFKKGVKILDTHKHTQTRAHTHTHTHTHVNTYTQVLQTYHVDLSTGLIKYAVDKHRVDKCTADIFRACVCVGGCGG